MPIKTKLVMTIFGNYVAQKKINVSELFFFQMHNGILLPKLLWPTLRKYFCSDREKLLKFEAEGWEFAHFLRSLKQFIQTVKCQDNFW